MATDDRNTTFSDLRPCRAARLGLIATALLAGAAPAQAQLSLNTPTACTPPFVETRLLEWDIEAIDDIVSGAIAVDDRSSSRNSKVWFVTRNGEPRVYRLTPGRSVKTDPAQTRSWSLGALQTGGVRLRHSDDGRFVFVNINDDNGANGALVAVDTRDNLRFTWIDRPITAQMSDVSVDTRGGAYSVFTAAPEYDPNDFAAAPNGVIQRLRPDQPQFKDGQWIVPAQVTRWPVGGAAGTCQTDLGPSAPCIPGVVVDRRHGHPVYFSAPEWPTPQGAGAVGELDPRPVKCDAYDQYNSCARVRYWPIPNPNPTLAPVFGPRQLLVDDNGKVWGITDSGHLFALEVDRSKGRGVISLHNPDGPVDPEDLFAVAPDGGTIGFTDAQNNEVSVLFPNRLKISVSPDTRFVKPVSRTLNAPREDAMPRDQDVLTREVTAMGQKYTKENDGTYVETDVSTGFTADDPFASFTPTGMSPDGARRTGSFFYGVTAGTPGFNRIGHFEVRVEPDRELEHRKDDDDYDDDGDDDEWDDDDDNDGIDDEWDDDDDNDCIPDMMDNDHDNDGVENEHDSKSHRENKRTDRGSMAPGESKGYEMEATSNSVAMLAIVEAATLTTPLSIEIVDPNGVVVLSTPPALGKAVATATPALPGVYTIRVKNGGLSSTTYKTTLISKSIWF
jgi:hypothetical protein